MSPLTAPSPIELELGRIREYSKCGRHSEALAAAEELEATASWSRDVLYLIAANQRCLNRVPAALATLQRLEQQHPEFSLLYQERGYCFMNLRDARRAAAAFRQGVTINPALATSWMMLERLYRLSGDIKNGEMAAAQVAALARVPPDVVRAGSLFSDGELSTAENILHDYLRNAGEHVEAVRLLVRIEHRRGLMVAAERRLEAALQRVPTYRAARLDYVRILIDRQKYVAAGEEIKALLTLDPGNRDYLSLSAAACVGLGEHERAILLYRQLLERETAPAGLHVALGHCLQVVGRRQEAVESFQAAAAARPGFGDAYWSLANLKIYRFSPDEMARMRAAEAAPAAGFVDRYHLCFALGKALEDQREFAESWQFYERGNALQRTESRYRPGITETNARRQIEVCTAQFFAERAGAGAPNPDPIFILGLPRSGSTLIEQILSSHSQVESTHELADIQRIVLEMQGDRSDQDDPGYPGVLAELPLDEFRRLGERYLTDTRGYRRGRPFFIDKMPNNFRHIGLIQLMLPNAKIIDARREPMACCVGNLKQLFAGGQEFTYSVGDIARYYRSYLELMRHWDAVLPGRVLRVWLEDVVDDLEGNVRRILAFCGLEFEPACVEYYKNAGSVRSASSEQVRQPIFRDSLLQWQNYEPWLGRLKDDLGDALIRYRE